MATTLTRSEPKTKAEPSSKPDATVGEPHGSISRGNSDTDR